MKSFSKGQGEALEKISSWLKSPISLDSPQQLFKLFGSAGTGKTFLAAEVTEMAEEIFKNRSFSGIKPYHYAAFTGKACHVLSRKGCFPVATIHQLIYSLDYEASKLSDQPVFTLNKLSILRHIKLLILDECSMVNEKMAKDLMSFGTKILVLGDPGQLPPIEGSGFFTCGKPDHLLTEIHRQALESPIIRLAHAVRNGIGFKPGIYSDKVQVVRRNDPNSWEEAFHLSDQILCGTNKTRQNFNLNYRARYLGQIHPMPWDSDRLICLRNNHEKGLLNGSMWEPGAGTKIEKINNDWKMSVCHIDNDFDENIDVLIPDEFFSLGSKGDLTPSDLNGKDQFTFGYAITVHKSQGSQWDSVFLYNENYCFRQDAAKWLYTGITRAAERLVIAI